VHPTDHELMRLTAEGDSEAFSALLRRWDSRVVRVLATLVNSRADVDDLRQEVFIRVLRASDRYRDCGEFSTWLFRIVLNLARDHARRTRRRPQPLPEELRDEGIAPPAAGVSQRELADSVAASLAALPQELREVLVLKHYAELTFAEMAETLAAPASTLKSRLALAHRRLGAELARRGVRDSQVEQ
jgi:RNA polymerase sigma-70 factor (ECF subfamily)